jgi:dihydrolipoamide dehydrogenase
MTKTLEVVVPDIGDFENEDVIEVLVSEGARVQVEDSLITLESDKATLEIPSPHAGVVRGLKVSVGDKVSQGSPILDLEPEGEGASREAPSAPEKKSGAGAAKRQPAPQKVNMEGQAQPTERMGVDLHAEVLVLGAGPGGYTAAFRAADLGKQTVLVERYPDLGGVCLNVGCIPSKALLHVAQVINDARQFSAHGVDFTEPAIDLAKIGSWKRGVVKRLTDGLATLAKQRKVEVIRGLGSFADPHRLLVDGPDGQRSIGFDHAIVAVGSEPVQIPGFPEGDGRLMDSTAALLLEEIPKRLLVIGGGIIGLEMATVYDALGSRVSVVELMDGLIPGCDRDLVRPLQRRIEERYDKIYVKTRVTGIEAQAQGLKVSLDGRKAPASGVFDRVLMAVGRRPRGHGLGLERAGVRVDERGFVPVDRHQRTNVEHIFAIGDLVGNPMLAHKAVHEGKVAAEVIAGLPSAFDALSVPSVAYTDPEVAWMGLTETEAKVRGIEFERAVFPWAASGRALCLGREEGLTKLLLDKQSRRLLGAGIVGRGAGDLIAEAVLAMEMGADTQDIGLSIHPHPTLSETLAFAAEIAEGTITDLYLPRRRK